MIESFRPSTDRWWRRCAWAGVMGGVAMGLYLMVTTWANGRGFWLPMNLIGAVAPGLRPPVSHFALGLSSVGTALHLLTSCLWGLIYGAALVALRPRIARNWAGASLLGLGWGVAAWALMGKLAGPLVDPFIAAVPPAHFFVGHLIYGLVTALSLRAIYRNEDLVTVAIAPRIHESDKSRVSTPRR